MDRVSELSRRLISHFTFEAGEVPPTLSGYRAAVGMSLAEFRALCCEEEFRAAWEEAEARYLDTLTVGALLKKYDTGFVRHLLEGSAQEAGAPSEDVRVEIRVVE